MVIKTKLMLIIFTIFIVLGINMALELKEHTESLENGEIETSKAFSEAMASIIFSELKVSHEEQYPHIQHYVENMYRILKREIVVVDVKQKIIAATAKTKIGTFFACDSDDEVGKTIRDGEMRIFKGKCFNCPRQQVVLPLKAITDGKEIIGAVILGYSPANGGVISSVYKEWGKALFVSLVGMIIVIFLFIFILKPIEELLSMVKEIDRGNLDVRVTPTKNDEFRELFKIFNQMAANLKANKEELLAYSQNLKAEVALRTQNLEKALIRVEAANKAKSEFLANMNHEIRTPLNAVLGFASLLRDALPGPLNEKQQEYVNEIIAGGERLTAIISAILEIIELESNDVDLRTDRIQVKSILDSIASAYREETWRRNLSLAIEIYPEANIEIETDETKLGQAISNILDNAIKFTPQGGAINISVRRPLTNKEEQDFIEISIKDTGIGIKAENMAKLFTPFYQEEIPYTKEHRGIGLGLLLAKKLIELLGGKIWVESEWGKGSEVTFVTPVKQERGDSHD